MTLFHLPSAVESSAATDDAALIARVVDLARREREARADFIVHLAAFDRRRLYAPAGYPSLFAWLHEHLGFAKASAYRRVTAARLHARMPAVAAYLRAGRLSLTKLCLLKDVLEPENCLELLEQAVTLTEKEVEELATILNPRKAAAPPRDSIRPLPRVPAPLGAQAAPLDLFAVRAVAPMPPPSARGEEPQPPPQLALTRAAYPPAPKAASASAAYPPVPPPAAAALPAAPEAASAAYPPLPPPAAAALLPVYQFAAAHPPVPEPGLAAAPARSTVSQATGRAAALPPLPEAPGSVAEPRATVRHAIRMTVGPKFVSLLEEVRAERSHALPGASLETLFSDCMATALAAWRKRRHGATECPRSPKPPAEGARTIPAHVRRAVWLRDQGRCTFVSGDGHRCTATHRLELHHEHPFALGGEATEANIRILCAAHNQLVARADFGDGHMEQFTTRH